MEHWKGKPKIFLLQNNKSKKLKNKSFFFKSKFKKEDRKNKNISRPNKTIIKAIAKKRIKKI